MYINFFCTLLTPGSANFQYLSFPNCKVVLPRTMTARALARAFTKSTSRIRPKFWTGCPRCFLLVVIHVLNVCPSDMIWIKLITLSALLLIALATLRSAQVGDYADACAPWRPLRHQMWTRDPCLHRSVSKHGCPRRIRETEKERWK